MDGNSLGNAFANGVIVLAVVCFIAGGLLISGVMYVARHLDVDVEWVATPEVP